MQGVGVGVQMVVLVVLLLEMAVLEVLVVAEEAQNTHL
jgi:hypothetical protein